MCLYLLAYNGPTYHRWSHKDILLKVNIFVWRLLRNHLTTTNNLVKWRLLQPSATLCAGNCGKEKDINHLFLSCDFFGKVWTGTYNWLCLTTVHPAQVSDHLLQFGGGFSKSSCTVLRSIWLTCVWTIWHEKKFKSFKTKGEISSASPWKNKATIFLMAKGKSPKFCF